MNKQRIALTLFLAFISEIANKIVPLITLHFVATRLGTSAFGLAQFALWLIDWGIFVTVYGFGQVAPIMLRNADDPVEQRQINGSVVISRLSLALISSAGLLYLVRDASVFSPYQAAVVSSIGIMFTSAIDSAWILMARQRMALWSIFTIVSKFASLVAILMFIRSPDDAVTFVLITNGANALVSIASFVVALRLVGISWPHWSQIGFAIKTASPFAASVLFMLLLERFDIFLVEKKMGLEATGVYSAAAKLVASVSPIIVTITNIFYSEMIGHRDQQHIERHLRASLFWSVSAFAPVMVGVWFIDRDILTIVFGTDYAAGNYVLSLLVSATAFYGLITIFGLQMLTLKGMWRPLILGLGAGVFAGVTAGFFMPVDFGMLGIAWSATIARLVAAMIVCFVAVRVWGLRSSELLRVTMRAISPAIAMGMVIVAGRSFDLIPQELIPTIAVGTISFGVAFSLINATELKMGARKLRELILQRRDLTL